MDATEAAEYLEKRRQFAASVADVTSYYRQAVSEVQDFLDQVRVDGPGLTEGNAKPGKRRFALVAKKIAYAAKQIKGQKLQAENFVNLMLTELGEYLSYKSKTSWIQGPVKLVGGALAKTVNDYKLIWTNNKDLVRGTLAAKDKNGLDMAVAEIYQTCTPEFGMYLLKHQPRVAKDDPCGYSDWNFAVIFKGYTIPAEIQANTLPLMYGKMSKDDFMKQLHFDEPSYLQFAREMGFPGGISHAFYEIWRIDKGASEQSRAAASLGKAYNNLCRLENAGRRSFEVKSFFQLYDIFRSSKLTPKAWEILRHLDNHPQTQAKRVGVGGVRVGRLHYFGHRG